MLLTIQSPSLADTRRPSGVSTDTVPLHSRKGTGVLARVQVPKMTLAELPSRGSRLAHH